MTTIPVRANNRIWTTYRHFPYKHWYAIGELVDNPTQSYFDHRNELDPVLEEEGESFEVRLDYDRKNRRFSVSDNAYGMDLDDLRRALELASPPPDISGRSEFGMGMKTSACWLGGEWRIITKKLGSTTEYTVIINVKELATREGDEEIPVQEKTNLPPNQHYTRIEIDSLNRDIPPRTLGATRRFLVEMYKPDILSQAMRLLWDGEELRPEEPDILDTDGTIWKQDVEFEVQGKKVTGWIAILGQGARSRAGFNLYRRGRGIIVRPPGYRPELIFGENRNDLINQRLFGDLHLDEFGVNHLKDDLLWDDEEEEFEEKLRDVSVDYIQKARDYRPSHEGQGVPPAVVQTTDEQIVEELTDQATVDQLAIMEVIQPIQDEDAAIREARAELFRSRPGKEPRIFQVGRYTFTVYHPDNMASTEPYFVQESPRLDHIDIFINDNHPYAAAATEAMPQEYPMYARMCCYDAIVEYFLVHHPGELKARFPAQLKDQLLRSRTL